MSSGIVIGASHLIPIGVRVRSFLYSSGRIFGGFRHVTCTSETDGYGDPPDAPNRCHQIPKDIMNQLDCICRPWKYRYLAHAFPPGNPKNDTSKSWPKTFRRLQCEYAPGPDDAADGDPIPAVALEADVEEAALVVRPVAGVVSAPSRLDHDG